MAFPLEKSIIRVYFEVCDVKNCLLYVNISDETLTRFELHILVD